MHHLVPPIVCLIFAVFMAVTFVATVRKVALNVVPTLERIQETQQ